MASDPRHGKARGEVIEGKPGASPLRQIGLVAVVLAVVVGAFLLLALLVTDDPDRAAWVTYTSYGVLIGLVLLATFRVVRRRRSRQSLDQALRSRRGE